MIDAEGRELARIEGVQPARKLAELYLKAKAQAAPPSDDGVGRQVEQAREDAQDRAPADPEERSQASSTNPEPWKTVVRIKVKGNGSIGFGSGTIIHSTAEESIILTCAHIFKVEGRAPMAPKNFRDAGHRRPVRRRPP